MAAACLTGLPALTSVAILAEITFLDDPFFNGIILTSLYIELKKLNKIYPNAVPSTIPINIPQNAILSRFFCISVIVLPHCVVEYFYGIGDTNKSRHVSFAFPHLHLMG